MNITAAQVDAARDPTLLPPMARFAPDGSTLVESMDWVPCDPCDPNACGLAPHGESLSVAQLAAANPLQPPPGARRGRGGSWPRSPVAGRATLRRPVPCLHLPDGRPALAPS